MNEPWFKVWPSFWFPLFILPVSWKAFAFSAFSGAAFLSILWAAAKLALDGDITIGVLFAWLLISIGIMIWRTEEI